MTGSRARVNRDVARRATDGYAGAMVAILASPLLTAVPHGFSAGRAAC